MFRFVTPAGLLERYQLSARFFNSEDRVIGYVRSVGSCLLNYVTSHSRRPYNLISQWSDQHLGGPGFKSSHWAPQQILFVFVLCPHRSTLGQLLKVSHGCFFSQGLQLITGCSFCRWKLCSSPQGQYSKINRNYKRWWLFSLQNFFSVPSLGSLPINVRQCSFL